MNAIRSLVMSAAAVASASAQFAPVPPAPPAPPARAAEVAPFAFAPAPPPPAPPAPPEPFQALKLAPRGSFLGVNVREIDAARVKELKLSEERGVEITMVEEESPADKAGLKKGDVVLDYNGTRVEGTEQFVRMVRETPGGRQVKMTILRAGATQPITATVGQRKEVRGFKGEWFESPPPPAWVPDVPRPIMGTRSQQLGIEAETLDGQLAQYFGVRRGLLVRTVFKGSAAEQAGLKAGDVIMKAGAEEVDSAADVAKAIRARGDKKTVALTVMRDRKETSINVNFEDSDEPAQRKSRAVRQEFRF